MMKKLFYTLAALLPALPAAAQTGMPQTYRNAIVVSAHDHASAAGRDMMRKGGNAFDAAVSVSFALAVVHPSAGNIGGGGFMVARLADGTAVTLDFREKAPAASKPGDYLDRKGDYNAEAALRNHLSAGVPGSVDGMLRLLERYGKLSRATVLEPAIRLARDGFALRYEEATLLNRFRDDFARWPGSKVFLHPEGRPWQPGDLLKQPDLARTLERIAQKGRAGFYEGPTADLIVNDMKANGGVLSHDDLKSYASVWREPIRFTAFGHDFISMPPPSAGGVTLLQILKMAELGRLDTLQYNNAAAIHLLAEAERRAYADRNTFLGDPDFMTNPVAALTSDAYLAAKMKSFSPERATPSREIQPGPVEGFREPEETTHYSIVDPQGNAVAITTSLNSSFGNRITVPGTGMLWNNHIDDFSLKPGAPNQYGLVSNRTNALKPGKRMLSSMTPTIVLKDGKVVLVMGASGGSTISTTAAQIFVNTRLFGMNIQQAVSNPRFHHQWLPDQIFVDPFGFDEGTRRRLTGMGHTVFVRTAYIGRSECILIDANGLHGAVDPRGQDSVTGF